MKGRRSLISLASIKKKKEKNVRRVVFFSFIAFFSRSLMLSCLVRCAFWLLSQQKFLIKSLTMTSSKTTVDKNYWRLVFFLLSLLLSFPTRLEFALVEEKPSTKTQRDKYLLKDSITSSLRCFWLRNVDEQNRRSKKQRNEISRFVSVIDEINRLNQKIF